MKRVNLEPIITETSLKDAKSGWYTFRAPIDKNKNFLKVLAEKSFKVNVLKIKTLIVKGKNKKSLRTRREISSPDWKKMFVKLKEGQKIEAFDIG